MNTASDRSAAKATVKSTDEGDAELDATLKLGHLAQLEITKEVNRHAVEMHKAELGVVGRILGGEKSAPLAIAAVVLVAALVMIAGCFALVAWVPGGEDVWRLGLNGLFSLCSLVVGFIFGRGDKPK